MAANISKFDYLRFNAYSIKDLITKKLSEDTNFTDQIYPGSNLAILIDLVSYMYQVLMLNLNNAAAESMFSDTQIYENINRLCQFIGYNPKGMIPSQATFHVKSINKYLDDNITTDSNIVIPKFSYISTEQTDSNGKKIYYSFGSDDITISNNFKNNDFILYNGIWRLYSNIFTASGDSWETFILDGLKSDSAKNMFISNNHIAVCNVEVKYDSNSTESIESVTWFKPTSYGLFKSPISVVDSNGIQDRIYSDATVFNLRLNEDKTYVITFGDGYRGRKLKAGSFVYVFYLDTNGFDGTIINGRIEDSIKSPRSRFDFSSKYYKEIIDSSNTISNYEITIVNTSNSTDAVKEESVDDIRDFAPNWFRMGNRLVTKHDYEYYIKNSQEFISEIADVICMNNWEYIASFYKWLFNLGITKHKKSNYYLNQNRIVHGNYEFADPADSNNIYLWVTFTDNDNNQNATTHKIDQSYYRQKLLYIKDLTHEPVFLHAVQVNFAICAEPEDTLIRKLIKRQYDNNDIFNDSYIEITMNDLNVYSNMSISNQVAMCIIKYFNVKMLHIGTPVNFNDIQNDILEIEGIDRIRTIYSDPNNKNNVVIRNGISFASWTANSELIDVGDDLEVSSSSRTLEKFQIPVMHESKNLNKIMSRIKIIKRSSVGINHIQY